MPFRYVIDEERRLVISTALAVLTFAEVVAHQDGLRNDPKFSPLFNQFLDATKLTALDVSIEEAKTIARRPLFSPTSRRAWISAGSPLYTPSAEL